VERLIIDGGPLTPYQVAEVALGRLEAVPASDLEERLRPARDLVERAIESGEVIYGITTGFGALANTHIGRDEAETLQHNLLRSHAVGVGQPLPRPLVRAMLLLRARTLAQGHSGVRALIVERLLDMMNRGILPVVPSQGSVGASGDLAPFAHLALPLIGEGQVQVDEEVMTPEEAGLDPIRLMTKEGLSLLNGTEGMTAMGVLALHHGSLIAEAADAAAGLAVEALLASARPFRPELHALRPHPGQIASAARISALLEGSEIVASHADDFHHAVQDAYSLRCAPQVHGAVLDTLGHLRSVLDIELGSVVDNPIVFPDANEVLSGGNFHGEPLAFALDFAAIALSELGSISERRTDRLLDPTRSQGLPPFLTEGYGVSSGFMITQYLQAALVSENQVLSHPASVHSIPTSGSQEDHVSMGWGAGKKLLEVVANTRRVIAVEMLCATQGIEHRAPLRPAPGTRALVDLVRDHVAPLRDDRPLGPDIEIVARLIEEGAIAAALR
jgi:histidine ammonia-lyase